MRKASRKFSEEVLIVFGSIIIGVNFILFISNQAILVYCAAVLFALGNGLMWHYYHYFQSAEGKLIKVQYRVLQVVSEA